MITQQTTQFNLCTRDYITTRYPAWGQFFLPENLLTNCRIFGSVQFSRSVMLNSLRHHESQHARPPCPSPTPGVHPNPCPSSCWCHPAISSSVVPFSSWSQSLPAMGGSFLMSQLFTWGGQSIGVSASASVLPVNTPDWSPHILEFILWEWVW